MPLGEEPVVGIALRLGGPKVGLNVLKKEKSFAAVSMTTYGNLGL
jgi:hypothetical protein